MKVDESWYKKPIGVRTEISAGGVVVCKKDREVFVALTCENNYPDFVLPKGHQEKGESLEETAIREIKEEAGLDNLELLSNLGKKERMDGKKQYWKITYYFLFITNHQVNNHVKWFPISHLPNIFFPEQKQLIKENKDKILNLVK